MEKMAGPLTVEAGLAETWGLRPDGKASFTFYVLLHDEDLTGHLPEHANLAGRVRRIVEAWRP